MKKIKSIIIAVTTVISISATLYGCFFEKEKKIEIKREKNEYEEIIKIGDIKSNPDIAKKRTDTLIVGVNDIKGEFNPIINTDTYDLWACSLIFDGLLSHDETGMIIPNIAESFNISEEGKKYSFKIKSGVKFSDGSELTAEDVAFTYTALCDPSYSGPYGGPLRKLEGYEDYRAGEAEDVIGIEVVDKNNISFYFREPNSSLIYSFEMGILPKKYYSFEKGNIKKIDELLTKPMGAGPYMLSSYNEGKDIELTRNPYYFEGKSSIPKVTLKKTPGNEALRQLSTGEIDMAKINSNLENFNYLQEQSFINTHLYDDNGYQYIGLNMRLDKFKDKKVRQALLYGLDRENFVKEYYGELGSILNTPFAKCSWAYTKEANEYKYDKDKAEKLLDEAGWVKKEDGFRYNSKNEKFTIKWSTYEGNKYVESLIPLVQSNWKEIGVDLVIERLPFQQLVEKVYDNRDFEMYNMSWMLSVDPDPSSMFSKREDVPGGYNAVSWRNDESEALLDSALKESDINKRKEIYSKWSSLANEELPYLFLNQNKEIFAANMRVKGLKLSPYLDWTNDIYNLSLEKYDE